MARFSGLGYLAWAPLAQGRLTGKYSQAAPGGRLSPAEAQLTDAREDIVAATLAIADEVGCAPSAIALRWLIQHHPDVIPLLGARSSRQLEANLRCLEVELSAGQMDRLNAVSAIDPGSPAGFMRGPGRDFMWGAAGSVPSRPGLPQQPWWAEEAGSVT